MSASQKLIDKRIQEYKANPIYPLELGKIQGLFKNRNISVEQFKLQYHQDPIFCAELVSLAWQAAKNKDTHPFAADHAMSLIGIDKAKRHFSKLKERRAPSISDEVRFLLTSSLLAAELAKSLSNKPPLYWAALFHQLPDIYLWHMHPKSMWRVQYHVTKTPRKLTLFEEAKLGFNLFDWRTAIASQTQMGEANLMTYQKPRPNNVKELISYMHSGVTKDTPILIQWHHTDSWTILLANWLAKALLLPTMANSCRHYRLLIQQAFSLSNRKLAWLIGDSLALVSQNLINTQLLIPGINALYLRSKPVYPGWLISAENNINKGMVFNKLQEKIKLQAVQKTLTNPVLETPSEAQLKAPLKTSHSTAVKSTKPENIKTNALKNDNSLFINRLLQKPESFESSVKMISQTMVSIIEHLNFDRTTLLSVDHKTQVAKSKIALAQKGITKLRPDFSFKLNAAQVASPLRKFVLQQGGLTFSKNKHQKIWSKLPLNIQKEEVESFFFYSIKPTNRVKILIYVDSSSPGHFEGDTILRLKLLLNALNSALSAREANKKKAS